MSYQQRHDTTNDVEMRTKTAITEHFDFGGVCLLYEHAKFESKTYYFSYFSPDNDESRQPLIHKHLHTYMCILKFYIDDEVITCEIIHFGILLVSKWNLMQ